MINQTERVTSSKLIMGNTAPVLEVKTLEGNIWKLAEQTPKNYTMLIFYRGMHCRICEQYMTEVNQKVDSFNDLGVEIMAISGDTLEGAQEFQKNANLYKVKICYGLTTDEMRRWGLYLSKGLTTDEMRRLQSHSNDRPFEKETVLFNEPAIFLINPDNTLYYANIGSHPFSRVNLDFLIDGLDYIINRNYPVRGTEL